VQGKCGLGRSLNWKGVRYMEPDPWRPIKFEAICTTEQFRTVQFDSSCMDFLTLHVRHMRQWYICERSMYTEELKWGWWPRKPGFLQLRNNPYQG
jgi:hypothetical protein